MAPLYTYRAPGRSASSTASLTRRRLDTANRMRCGNPFSTIRALVPGNYQALAGMAGGPALREAPDAQAMIQDVMRELEAFRGMARGLMGVDPVTDIDSASVWIRLPADGLPAVLAVIRGTIGDDIVGRIASLTGAEVIEVHGRKALLAPDGVAMLAVKDGDLLVGTPAWVEVRLTEGWKPVRPRAAAARAAAMLENAPFFVAVSSPSRGRGARRGHRLGPGRGRLRHRQYRGASAVMHSTAARWPVPGPGAPLRGARGV